jgi:TolA-binding protein
MPAEAAERYVSGEMPEAERTAFEEHYFACDSCFRAVQRMQDAAAVLTAKAARLPGPAAAEQHPGRRPLRTTWMALAAMLIVGVVLWRLPQTGPEVENRPQTDGAAPPAPTAVAPVPPAPAAQSSEAQVAAPSREERIASLARFTPPPYVALTTRSDADAQAQSFESAMAHYTRGDYKAAARSLSALVDAAPDLAHARFFLGVSELMQRNTARAADILQQTAESGVTPYAEEAHFYLGKAALQAGDVDAARRELRLAAELEAGPQGEAARVLRELDALRR